MLKVLKAIFNRKDIGSVMVYYESFEKNILKSLANYSPEDEDWIFKVLAKIIDLYEPFGSFFYYNPKQGGSASLKNILPALTGLRYDEMEINNGQAASLQYLRLTFLKEEDLAYETKQTIRSDLLAYCALDTEGMIHILKKLYDIPAHRKQ